MAKKDTEKSSEKEILYPSSEFLFNVCCEDYNRVLSNYDKIYDRINILLTFCGVILLVILDNYKVNILFNWCEYSSNKKLLALLYFAAATSGVILLLISTIKCLILSRSKEIYTFNCNAIRSKKVYEDNTDVAALWSIEQYIIIINNIRENVNKKQKGLNTALIINVISIITYAFSRLIYLGGEF